jgi:hypothetical protein
VPTLDRAELIFEFGDIAFGGEIGGASAHGPDIAKAGLARRAAFAKLWR